MVNEPKKSPPVCQGSFTDRQQYTAADRAVIQTRKAEKVAGIDDEGRCLYDSMIRIYLVLVRFGSVFLKERY